MSDTSNSRKKLKTQFTDENDAGSDELHSEEMPSQDGGSIKNSMVRLQTPQKIASTPSFPTDTPLQAVKLATSLNAPNLQPPELDAGRGRKMKSYSQSPPRSPARSPVRSPGNKLELIQLSPVKNSRKELQEIYNNKHRSNEIERLCINKLVLNNFKSYAGQQIIGPFHSNFSAIVGPNGSGKSNVIDSMLFVFGFRASKMRQDRVSDLIHKSEEYPDIKSCSVEVYFHYVVDNADGSSHVNVDMPGLVVTRQAFKNNSSKYFVNGVESNYTEVTSLLKKEGIDLDHNRFLILQGEVENIAQLKPKAEKDNDDGLLEYLEDIIGTAKYKPLIEEKLTEIEVLNETCLERKNRFQLVEREKDSLEDKKNEAMAFLENEKKLTINKSKILQHKIWRCNTKLTDTLQKLTELNSEHELNMNKYETLRDELSFTENKYNELVQHCKELTDQEKAFNAKVSQFDGEKVSIEEQLKAFMKKRDKHELELQELSENLNELRSKTEVHEKQEQTYLNRLSELSETKEKESEILEKLKLDLKDKTVVFTAEIVKHEKDMEPWVARLQDLHSQLQVKESEKVLIEEGRSKQLKEIEELKHLISTLEETRNKKLNDIEKGQKQLKITEKQISTGDATLADMKTKLQEMQGVLNQRRQKVSDASASLSTAQNKSKVLTSLLKLQKSGRISGFHGRLGDLGVIEDRYNIAISTACPRLDDIVVDSVDCGQKCIEYLRKNSLGYARFILLDKLRTFNLQTIETPKNVPRLFDLVEVKNEKYLPAFYSVLRDTLVAEDLKTANSVAYGKKRYRVVTLDGKLIDISGTMSGGGNHVSKGLMRLKKQSSATFDEYSPEELKELEQELNEREKSYQIANETFNEMTRELRKMKMTAPEIELQISKDKLEVESINSDCSTKKLQLGELVKAYQDTTFNDQQLRKISSDINEIMDQEASINEQTKSKTDRINTLKNEIMKAGGSELQVQKCKVESIDAETVIIQSNQKKLKSNVKKTANEMKRNEKKTKEIEAFIAASDTNVNEFENGIKRLADNILKTEKDLAEINDLKEKQESEAEVYKVKFLSLRAESTELNSKKVELKNTLEKLSSSTNHLRKELSTLNDELNNLKIRDVTAQLDFIEASTLNEISNQATKSAGLEAGSLLEKTEFLSAQQKEMEIDEVPPNSYKLVPQLTSSELKSLDIEFIEAEIIQLQDIIDGTNVDVDVLEEYAKRVIEYQKRKQAFDSAVQNMDDIRKLLEGLKKTRLDEFMEGFGIISVTLKEMYQMITMGGNAELELVDSLDPFSEGVTFSVMPPKKSWRNISNLSGGEKTLSSLALVFALHKYKPTPLYVMDEIDAALDFRNVSIVANYLKESTKNAQFIVISLRNNMFELAEQLVGIYKCNNQTKSVALKNHDILCRE